MTKIAFNKEVGRDQIVQLMRWRTSPKVKARLGAASNVLRSIQKRTGGKPVLFGGALRDCFLRQSENDFDIGFNLFAVPDYKQRLLSAFESQDRVDDKAYRSDARGYRDMFDQVFEDIAKEIYDSLGHQSEAVDSWFHYKSGRSYGGLFAFHSMYEGKKIHMILGNSNDYKEIITSTQTNQNYIMSAQHMADRAESTLNAIAMTASGRLYADYRFLNDVQNRVFRERDRVVLYSDRFEKMKNRVPGLKAV